MKPHCRSIANCNGRNRLVMTCNSSDDRTHTRSLLSSLEQPAINAAAYAIKHHTLLVEKQRRSPQTSAVQRNCRLVSDQIAPDSPVMAANVSSSTSSPLSSGGGRPAGSNIFNSTANSFGSVLGAHAIFADESQTPLTLSSLEWDEKSCEKVIAESENLRRIIGRRACRMMTLCFDDRSGDTSWTDNAEYAERAGGHRVVCTLTDLEWDYDYLVPSDVELDLEWDEGYLWAAPSMQEKSHLTDVNGLEPLVEEQEQSAVADRGSIVDVVADAPRRPSLPMIVGFRMPELLPAAYETAEFHLPETWIALANTHGSIASNDSFASDDSRSLTVADAGAPPTLASGDAAAIVAVQHEHHCPFCEKTFRRLAVLSTHLRKRQPAGICEGQQPLLKYHHVCVVCAKAFKTKSAMNRHANDVHRPLVHTHICPICDRPFKSRQTLQRHTSRHLKRHSGRRSTVREAAA